MYFRLGVKFGFEGGLELPRYVGEGGFRTPMQFGNLVKVMREPYESISTPPSNPQFFFPKSISLSTCARVRKRMSLLMRNALRSISSPLKKYIKNDFPLPPQTPFSPAVLPLLLLGLSAYMLWSNTLSSSR